MRNICMLIKRNDLPQIIQDLLEQYSCDESLYWFPLCKLKKALPVAAYDLDAIYKSGKIAQIESCLKEMSILRCEAFQVQLYNMEIKQINLIDYLYEKDNEGYSFPWQAETYYFDSFSENWVIYVSHEGTITFTGKAIVEAACKNIDDAFRLADNQ